jgi:hypothetical protein
LENVAFKNRREIAEEKTGISRIAGSGRGEKPSEFYLLPEQRGVFLISRRPVLLC